MEIFAILLAAAGLAAIAGTIVAVVRDGHGHTPEILSVEPWKAGNLPSVPYASASLNIRSAPRPR